MALEPARRIEAASRARRPSCYPREWRGRDLAAGLSSAAVVVPKAMAHATVAGLPPQVGLSTAFVPMASGAPVRARRGPGS